MSLRSMSAILLQVPLREYGASRLESSGYSHCNLLSNDLEFNPNFVLNLN
jgi:hypothetical protein